MNKDFSRILTLLREERGLSQKKAASDLGISQPLLSHYENGLRECSLDFVIKVADYYEVTCDYLLGRTNVKAGGQIVISDIPQDDESIQSFSEKKSNMITVLNKKIIFNSLNIIFDILEKINHKGLTSECSKYLMSAAYSIFRLLYSSNPHNSQNMFSVSMKDRNENVFYTANRHKKNKTP